MAGAFEPTAFDNASFYVTSGPPVTPRGIAIAAVLFPDANEGSSVTYSWQTDITPARSGHEKRVARRACPRETYELTFLLTDAQVALLQGQLVTAAAQGNAFGVALPWEGLALTSTTTGTTVNVPTTALSDWCYPGQTVAIVAADGSVAFTSYVVSVGSASLVLNDAVGAAGVIGARILPTIPCFLEGLQFGLYNVNAGTWKLKATATYFGNATSDWSPVGAPSITTYTDSSEDGVTYPVFTRGLVTETTTPKAILPGTTIKDLGGALAIAAPRSYSDDQRQILFRSITDSDRQYLKAFQGATLGQQCAFLLPTWKPDLIVASGDASGGTLHIKSETGGGMDYANGIFPQTYHLQIKLTDGSVHYVTVTDAADNFDGTQTLDLDVAVVGTIAMVSLLERCRFDTDDFTVTYTAGARGTATLPVHVVQPYVPPPGSPAYDDIDQSDQAAVPVELYSFITPATTYRVTSGGKDIAFGGNTYSSLLSARSSISLGDVQGNPTDVTVQLDAAHPLAQLYVNGVPPNQIEVTIQKYFPAYSLSLQLWDGFVSGISFAPAKEGAGMIATFRVPSAIADALSLECPSVVASRTCQHFLYDTKCTVAKTSFQVSTTISSIAADGVTISFGAATPGPVGIVPWALHGAMVHTPSGESRTIIGVNSLTQVVLEAPFPGTVAHGGDAIVVYGGCDHSSEQCEAKFSNGVNFGGDPCLPLSNLFYVGLVNATYNKSTSGT